MNHHPARTMVWRRWSVRLVAAVVIAAFGAALVLGVWRAWPGVSEEDVREVVIATIQREAPASFLVTGTLDVTARTTIENTKYLLPDLFRLDLGTTRATVRAPARLSYGFDVRHLAAEMIALDADGTVTVTLPALSVHAVEVDLDRMEVETEVGWARLYASSGRRVERQAIRRVQQILQEQGRAHLDDAAQPRINTARALQALLTPVLEAAGIDAPRFRFQIGPDLVLEPRG